MSAVRVGVGVFVLSPSGDKFITGTRIGSLGAGTLALPGGHHEFGESFEECARREVEEETGIELDPSSIHFLTAVSTVFDAEKHYVTIFMAAHLPPGAPKPQVLEPEKCLGWEWHSFAELRAIAADEMPSRELFLPLTNLINSQPTFDPAKAYAALPKPEGWEQKWTQSR